jgi:hypothetical protein
MRYNAHCNCGASGVVLLSVMEMTVPSYKSWKITYLETSGLKTWTLEEIGNATVVCYVVSYGLIFWGGEGESNKILKIQKRILRLIKGVNSITSCRPIVKELKILTVTSLYVLEALCFCQKYKLYSIRNFDLYEYNTRRRKDLHVLNCNTSTFKRSVINMGIKYCTIDCLWN